MKKTFATVGIRDANQEGTSVDPEFHSTSDIIIKEFKESVKRRSIIETDGGVTDSYREHNLTEPEQEFYPKLKRIDFYRGSWSPPTQEYVKEAVFAIGDTDNKGSVEVSKDEILHFSDNQRYKAIVGQAGSGKTTLMKRLARGLISRKLLIQNGQKEPFHPEVVHYLNIRDIPVTGKELKTITPCDLLFGKVMASVKKGTIENGFEWLQTTQDMAVFFFDGLDQAPWSLEDDSNPMRYEDDANTATIMKNLFVGNLFPNVLIIVSSREHTLSPLTGNLRPSVVIGLAGFTMEIRKQIFIELAGEDGERLWNLMCTRSPALVPLGSIPIFLVFIVIVYKFDPENPPETMSGVMIKILQIFLQSDHAHERENIIEILKGLKQMSFRGTEEKRVLFTQKDLKEFNLIPKSVRDLVLFVPGSTLLGRNLMEGHYRLFFCHQSIQEMLTALHIIELPREAFINSVNKSREDHWSVVRRFLCGVLLNEETYNDAAVNLIKVTDLKYKRKILKRSMNKQTSGRLEGRRDQLEMFAALYEAADSSFIQSCVHEVNIENQALSPNDMHVISSMLLRCSEVNKVRLCRCNLNEETMGILNAGLKICKIQILGLSEITDIEIDGWKIIGSIVQKCEVENLTIGRSGLSIDKLTALQECLGNSKIKVLDVSLDTGMTADVCRTIGSMVKKYEVRNLEMGGCQLSKDEFEALQEGLGNSKIERLSLIANQVTADSLAVICSIIRQCRVKKTFIDRCSIEEVWDSPRKVGRLSVEGRKFSNQELSEFGSVLRYYDEIQEVVMENCGLNADGINIFMEAVGEIKIRIFNVNSNRNLGTNCCAAIVSMVKKCQVEELKMMECEHSIDEVKAFMEGLDSVKLEKFELTILNEPSSEYLKAIADLVHRCHAQTFVLRNAHHLDSMNKDLITQSAGKKKVLFFIRRPSISEAMMHETILDFPD